MNVTEKITHAAERKAFETMLDTIIKKSQTQDVGELFESLVNMVQKIHGSVWSPETFDTLRKISEDPNGKWAHYVQRLLRDVDLAGVAFGEAYVHQLLVRIYEIQLLAQGRQRRLLEADDVPEYARQVADVFEAFLFLVAAYERREVAQCVEKEVGAYLVGNGVVLAAEVLYPEHLDLFFMPAFLVDHQYDAADQ